MTAPEVRPRLSRRKRLIFAVCAILLALAVPVVALFGADLYLHTKYQRSAGFNIWGYRGPIVHGKRAGEIRVAAFGGSTTFGYGVSWNEAMPAQLATDLAAASPRPQSVVNLGYNNEGAYSFAFTMKDYEYLDYDIAILYTGYNDLMGDPRAPNLAVFRHDSPIFRLTGYLPIFPIVFKEKAGAMLHGGDVSARYVGGGKTVFHPGLATRTAADLIQAAANVGESLEQQVGRVAAEPSRTIEGADTTGCRSPWQQYCASIRKAVEYGLQHDKRVLVVGQPYVIGEEARARHVEQQAEMQAMLARQFGSDPRVRIVNLGTLIDLSDTALSFDRMHLTARGNAMVAKALVSPVLELESQLRRPE
jgi:hypothetical protein